ncbi:unnamed protein product [Pylaiella littoralis]
MNRSSNSRGRVINTDHSPCTMRSPGLLKEDLAGLNRSIQTVLNKKGAGIKDGLTAQNCARLVRHAQKSADPLAGEKANPIPPGGRVPFSAREAAPDIVANKLMKGSRFEDGGGRKFVANKIAGNGDCLFNSVAFAGYGPSCTSMRKVLEKALPLRAAVCRVALADLERLLSDGPDGWGLFFCFWQAFDSVVADRLREAELEPHQDPVTGRFSVEMARVFVLLCIQAMIPDKSYTQQVASRSSLMC